MQNKLELKAEWKPPSVPFHCQTSNLHNHTGILQTKLVHLVMELN